MKALGGIAAAVLHARGNDAWTAAGAASSDEWADVMARYARELWRERDRALRLAGVVPVATSMGIEYRAVAS